MSGKITSRERMEGLPNARATEELDRVDRLHGASGSGAHQTGAAGHY
jgi:hypothetical protein